VVISLESRLIYNASNWKQPMRTGYTGHVSTSEWRWVTVLSSLLVLGALLPFLWVALSNPASENRRFMGALHEYPQTAAYLSKMTQGSQGEWLGRYLHTPEPHNGVFIDDIYIVLGQFARLTRIPVIVLFHVARIGAAFFMYAAIYYLGAAIWMRVRSRKMFFAFSVFGSGFGWLLAPLLNNSAFPDLLYPELYPFYSTLVNVHLPLVLGCMAILISAIIEVLRPGTLESPTINNAGGAIVTFSFLLTFLYPPGIVPIGIAFAVVLLARILQRKPVSYSLRWILCLVLPALPLLAYYASVYVYNPVVSQLWLTFNRIHMPPFWVFLASLGLPLLIALPGLYRAIRRFEQDGNQVMLLWLMAMVLLIYFTPVIQIHFGLGLMLAIAYFVVRSAEDFWFQYIARPWRYRAIVALIPVIALSLLLVLITPVYPLMTSASRQTSGLLLERDYSILFQWLLQRPSQDYPVLAAPQVGVWLPALGGMPVIYGSEQQTLDPDAKRQAVESWYRDGNAEQCSQLLNGAYSIRGDYVVRYIVYGPRERALGDAPCLEQLEPVLTFGDIELYSIDLNAEAE
jgi:hypothetical protein